MDALETRMGDLTERVRATGQDAAAARVLAGAADRDVADLHGELRDFRRAATAGFNAVREDIADLRNRFDQVDNRFDEVDNQFDQVGNGFIEVRGMLDATAAGQQRIVELLERLVPENG